MLYLDHAATSHPKPSVVLDAIARWFTELGVSADRGDSDACQVVGAELARVRELLARDCAVPASRVVFCSGATEALNLFFQGFLRAGDRVITTELEHSSVARPLVARRDAGAIDLDVLPSDGNGGFDPQQLEDALRRAPARLFVFSHASNVSGRLVDAATLVDLARARGCATLCDASQTAGLVPLDSGADATAASAHKSLLGPPGLGFLAVRDDVDVSTTKFGGTGSSAALERHPQTWPARLEAGTPNSPAIFGLGAALDWIAERGRERILADELAVCDALCDALDGRVQWHGLDRTAPRVPIVSFGARDFDPAELGLLLAENRIHVRSGFHCAPWIHRTLGTATAGTVRVSPGPFVNAADVLRVSAALPC